MTFDKATEALVMEAKHRYHTDAEFHVIVDTAVQASIPPICLTNEDLERFVRNLMTRASSLGLVLQERSGND